MLISAEGFYTRRWGAGGGGKLKNHPRVGFLRSQRTSSGNRIRKDAPASLERDDFHEPFQTSRISMTPFNLAQRQSGLFSIPWNTVLDFFLRQALQLSTFSSARSFNFQGSYTNRDIRTFFLKVKSIADVF